MMLGCDEDLAVRLKHLRTTDLPRIQEEASAVLGKLAVIDERLVRLEADKVRVPDEDQIRAAQEALEKAREVRREKLGRLEALRMRKTFLQKQRDEVEARLDKLSERSLDARVGEDDRQRMLKHSMKVRETLGILRGKIVRRHVARLEELVLESFQRLLRKDGLATGLSINPDTFDTTLVGRDGRAFSFDRLSAGERQLLATSLLWGLARASGRPVPTIIDTPLGRLDSSHRRHMVERYFPHASHQVILLSTDEEIVGTYLETLAPYIARSYFLEHDEGAAQTRIASGYFSSHAAAH
jgi:DNA sulfur modification protein DndD